MLIYCFLLYQYSDNVFDEITKVKNLIIRNLIIDTLLMSSNSDEDEVQQIKIPELNKIVPEKNKYPYCIVWTSIPVISWVCPCIGHVGIGDSHGAIHDFAGPYTVSVDDFAFGNPYKYTTLNITSPSDYDTAIKKADEKYSQQMHSLCCNNCHSHVADALNRIQYENRKNHTMVDICCKITKSSKFISKRYKIYAALPFIVLGLIILCVILMVRYS